MSCSIISLYRAFIWIFPLGIIIFTIQITSQPLESANADDSALVLQCDTSQLGTCSAPNPDEEKYYYSSGSCKCSSSCHCGGTIVYNPKTGVSGGSKSISCEGACVKAVKKKKKKKGGVFGFIADVDSDLSDPICSVNK